MTQPLLRTDAALPLRVALLGGSVPFARAVAVALRGRDVQLLTVAPPHISRQVRDLHPDLCIVDLSDPAVVADNPLRRLLGELPIIAAVAEAGREFELADLFDVLPYPLDPARLGEDLDYLRSAARPGDPPPLPPTDAEVGALAEFLVVHSGLHFDQRNRTQLVRGVMQRVRAVAAPSVAAYHAYLLKNREKRHELKKLVALLTIGETSFFRYAPHFAALTERVLPELIERNRRERRLRIWSAGCASGEEVYSLAILLQERFPQLAGWEVTILGTDISKHALAAARKGTYRERTLRNVEPELLARWFVRNGSHWRLSERLLPLVRFDFLNLQSESYPDPNNGTADCDLILCRNVMIYFRPETVRTVLGRLRRALRTGGYLFLGHAETLGPGFLDFRRCQHQGGSFYRAGDPVPTARAPGAAVTDFCESGPEAQQDEKSKQPQLQFSEKINIGASLTDKSANKSGEKCGVISPDDEKNRTASRDYAMVKPMAAPDPEELLERGFALADEGRFAEALQLCQTVLAQDDLCARGYLLRGLIHDHLEEGAAAADDYRRTILLDLNAVMAHCHLGHLYWRTHRTGEAVRSLRTAIRLLRKLAPQAPVPDAGGLNAAALLERCIAELRQLEG